MGRNRLIADRLLDLLTAEVARAERWIEDNSPCDASGRDADTRGNRKERIETIGHLARTLDKLIDVRRIERACGADEDGEDAETERLREELVKRLKILDARRMADIVAARAAANTSESGEPEAVHPWKERAGAASIL